MKFMLTLDDRIGNDRLEINKIFKSKSSQTALVSVQKNMELYQSNLKDFRAFSLFRLRKRYPQLIAHGFYDEDHQQCDDPACRARPSLENKRIPMPNQKPN